MDNEKIIREWIRYADEDFDFAVVNLEEQDKFFTKICFHFQQAGEKYLKAYIVNFKLKFKKIHDLSELVETCQKQDSSLSEIREEADFLTDYYVDTRYPTFWPVGATREEAEKARAAAEKIGNLIKEKIGLKSK